MDSTELDSRELMSVLQCLIVIVDTNRVVAYLNDRAQVALGMSVAEGMPLRDLCQVLHDLDDIPLTVGEIVHAKRPLPIRIQRGGATIRDAVLHVSHLDDGRLCIELMPCDGGLASQLDPLTGLMDRSRMIHWIDRLIDRGDSGAIVLMEIDRLKIVNDYMGYAAGDRLIQALGQALRTGTPSDILLSRWSGHEFMALVPVERARDLGGLGCKFLDIAHRLPLIKEMPLPGRSVTLSIGLTRFGPHFHSEPAQGGSRFQAQEPQPGRSATRRIDPLSRVNAAIFEAKRKGRNCIVDADTLTKPSVYVTGGALEAALDEDRIVAAVQPIIELSTGRVIADESLARLIAPDGRIVPAAEFIEAASALQIAHRIDHSIIRQTINYCVTSHFESPRAHFVNISSDFLRHPDLIEDTIAAAMDACSCTHPDTGLNRSIKPLVVEITERELLENTQEALTALAPLIDFGLRLAIDDFGSGYSSYRYLLDLPFHFLKIEGDLVRRVRHDAKANRIVRHIQAMAADIGLTTVAEFVGDQETADELAEMGIDWAQGFHFGRPQLMRQEPANLVHPQNGADLAQP